MSVPFLLPSHYSPGTPWLLPAIEGFVLVALVIVDPRSYRPAGGAMGAGAVRCIGGRDRGGGAAWSAARLVWDLLHGSPATTVATALLVSGALVWMQTVLAFGFLYWELDGGGGAVNRHLRPRAHPDLAFPPSSSSPDSRPPEGGDPSSSTTCSSR